ncbi:MAG: hypothetical protein KDC53_11250 [Saprospiraceae bacterium]|nr:hypothetical protein [Saprospiraceae bacterium]
MPENNRLNLNQVELGRPLPPWSLDPIFDDPVPSVDYFLGKPLLVLIFSFVCPGCIGRAIPFANRMVYENGESLQVLGIHSNFSGHDLKDELLINGKKNYYIRFPYFKDKNFDTTFINYGAGGTPHWLLVDAMGNVCYSIFGSDPNNALLRLDLRIAEMLQESKLP